MGVEAAVNYSQADQRDQRAKGGLWAAEQMERLTILGESSESNQEWLAGSMAFKGI